MRVALALLALAACGSDDAGSLSGGPTVGTACTSGPTATMSEVPNADAALYTRAYADLRSGRTGLWLIPSGGDLSLTTCMLSYTGTTSSAWKVTAEAQTLGTFTVADNQVSVLSVEEPVAGSITIDGYNAELGYVCGSMDVTLDTGSRLRGSFGADVFCE